jgi:hypothetical protein
MKKENRPAKKETSGFDRITDQLMRGDNFKSIFENADLSADDESLGTSILNSFSEIIAFYEPDHRIKWLNEAGKKKIGVTDNSYIGKKCYQVWYGSKSPCTKCPVVTKDHHTTDRVTTRNDSGSWLVRHTPLFDRKGKTLGYIEFSADITEKLKMEALQKELAADSLYINQKNKITQEIKTELDKILDQNKKYSRKNFSRIYEILTSYTRLDNDWDMLIKHFEQIHPDFFNNLIRQFPSLSVNDLKHCACIRLNFDTKETARFFNVRPESVKMSRVRLKKKLNLSQQSDLRSFILNY